MEANLLTQWSRLLLGSLAQAGIRRAVVSPGSRSTPLVSALLEQSTIEVDVVIDERSAGFYALGQAKLTGQPSLLVCTSGSAPAHYLPALIEANESHTPLLVLSADRPASRQGNRSPQTIDQTRLFGLVVRGFVDLGTPEAHLRALSALRRKALQAVATACWPRPGPVHLNFPAEKPLEPVQANTASEHALEARVSALLAAPPTELERPTSAPSEATLKRLVALAEHAERPLVLAGPCAPHLAHEFAPLRALLAARGWPLLAETTSQNRLASDPPPAHVCDGFDALYRSRFADDYAPDLVLQLGEPPTSGAWAALVERTPEMKRIIISPNAWADPHDSALAILPLGPAALARALSDRLPPAAPVWRERLASANAAVWRARDHALTAVESSPSSEHATAFTEAQVFAVLERQLAEGELLVLGNSLPVRLADSVLRSRALAVPCLSQRGANGIDGLISLASGAARVHSGHTLLVLGDVSALHDVGGLFALSRLEVNATVLVIHNQGGRLFEQLPIAAQRSDLDAWLTPHAVRFDQAAQSFGLRSFLAEDAHALALALELGRHHAGPSLIEARVEPSGAGRFYAALGRALDAELAALAGEAAPGWSGGPASE